MEIRYTTPYVSGLNWILNDPINESVPVQDQSGQQGVTVVKRNPGLTVEVTPYLGTVPCKIKSYEFLKGSTTAPSMESVLAAAGIDVAAAWAGALDSMANIFPILKDPVVGDELSGTPVYMRLDAWKANLPWVGSKTIAAILGVYEDTNYSSPTAYVQLVFADGASLRQRESQKQEMQKQIVYAQSVLDGTLENWANISAEEQTRMLEQAPRTISAYTDQLAVIDSQLVAPLSQLLGDVNVQQSIGALLVGTFTVLKNTSPEWVDVDVNQVMSKFALPSVE